MPATNGLKTARSWHSFDKTLNKIMSNFNIKTVLEYGPGVSTKIILGYPSVNRIYSIEHDDAWYHKYVREINDKVELALVKDLNKYPYFYESKKPFDLIFIDGRERERCLELAHSLLSNDGIVIIHDSEREQYQDGINKFREIFFTDNGSTCTMTNSAAIGFNLDSIL